jgi:hypothetical protein
LPQTQAGDGGSLVFFGVAKMHRQVIDSKNAGNHLPQWQGKCGVFFQNPAPNVLSAP